MSESGVTGAGAGGMSAPGVTGADAGGSARGRTVARARKSPPGVEAGGRRDAVLRLLRESAAPISITDVARRVGVHPNTARFHLAALVRSGQAELSPGPRARPGRPAQLFRAVPGMDPTGPRHFRLLAEILASTLADDPDARARAADAGRQWGRRQLGPEGSTPSPASSRPSPARRQLGPEGSRPSPARRQLGPGGSPPSPAGSPPWPPSPPTGPQPAPASSRPSSAGTCPIPDDEGRVEADAAALVAMLGELGFAPERESGSARIGLRRCPFLEVAQQRTDVVCGVHLGLMQGALAARDAAVTVEELEAFVEPDLCVAHLTLAGGGR